SHGHALGESEQRYAAIVGSYGLHPVIELLHRSNDVLAIGFKLGRDRKPAVTPEVFWQFFGCLHARDRIPVVERISQWDQIIFVCSEPVEKDNEIRFGAGCFVRPTNVHAYSES